MPFDMEAERHAWRKRWEEDDRTFYRSSVRQFACFYLVQGILAMFVWAVLFPQPNDRWWLQALDTINCACQVVFVRSSFKTTKKWRAKLDAVL